MSVANRTRLKAPPPASGGPADKAAEGNGALLLNPFVAFPIQCLA